MEIRKMLHTYRLRLMSLWQYLNQLRFVLHILRQNFDVFALRSIFPMNKNKNRKNGNHVRIIKIDGCHHVAKTQYSPNS